MERRAKSGFSSRMRKSKAVGRSDTRGHFSIQKVESRRVRTYSPE